MSARIVVRVCVLRSHIFGCLLSMGLIEDTEMASLGMSDTKNMLRHKQKNVTTKRYTEMKRSKKYRCESVKIRNLRSFKEKQTIEMRDFSSKIT